jgi:hypothetical protein
MDLVINVVALAITLGAFLGVVIFIAILVWAIIKELTE